jgi:hypothetical protein
MKKLKFLAGGQPFRSTDFEVIQDNIFDQIKLLFDSMTTAKVILTGVETDWNPDVPGTPGEEFAITEGFIWDGTEVCRVLANAYVYHAGYTLYMRRATEETAYRMVDNAEQAVMIEAYYELLYAYGDPGGGAFPFTDLKTIKVLNEDDYELKYSKGAELTAQYTPVAMDGMEVYQNSYGDTLLYLNFTSSLGTGGVLCTLPEGARPPMNIYASYRAGNTIQVLIIRTNGEVEVITPSSSLTNTINYRFNTNLIPKD